MCDRPKDKGDENVTADITAFKSDYDTLQNLGLPLTLNEKNWSELSRKHYDKFGIKGGYDLLTMPFSKLIDSDSYKGVIFIYDDPILITIDKNSNPIDTLFLLGDNYSNDPSIKTIEQARINSDLTIQLLDSVFTYDLGKDEDRIESSEKLTIKKENYRIEKTGHIKKIE
jgi:hypothetical protein